MWLNITGNGGRCIVTSTAVQSVYTPTTCLPTHLLWRKLHVYNGEIQLNGTKCRRMLLVEVVGAFGLLQQFSPLYTNYSLTHSLVLEEVTYIKWWYLSSYVIKC
jgi:hypothetical protein